MANVNTQQFLDTAGLSYFYGKLKEKLETHNTALAVDASTVNGLTVETAVPANAKFTDTDTKNTAGATASTSKLYLVGAAGQTANPQTYSNAAVYAENGALTASSFSGDGANLTNVNAATVNSHSVETDVPSGAVFTDTKNTAGAVDSTSKLYLVGATAQGANPTTNSTSKVYAENGTLTATSFSGDGANLTNVDATTVGGFTVGISVPADAKFTDNDTKNTTGAVDSTSKLYLVGTIAQGANPTTNSTNKVYAENGTLTATKFAGDGSELTGVVHPGDIATAMNFKGTVDDLTALKALTTAITGDMYIVKEDGADDTGEKNITYVCSQVSTTAISGAADATDLTVVYGNSNKIKWERLGPTMDIEAIPNSDIDTIFA